MLYTHLTVVVCISNPIKFPDIVVVQGVCKVMCRVRYVI